MNIKPFRLTAGAYLLSKRYERKRGEVLQSYCSGVSHAAEISSRCNSIILLVFFVSTPRPTLHHPTTPPSSSAVRWMQAKKKKLPSTFSLSLYRCAILQIALEWKKEEGGGKKWMEYQRNRRVHESFWGYWVLENMFVPGSNIKELPKSQ